MFSLDNFISDSLAASKANDPVAALMALLRETVGDVDALLSALPETADDETLIHASDILTIYDIKLPPGILYPPHNHRMRVVIGFYEGCETNLIYKPGADGGPGADGVLKQVDRLDFQAPTVAMFEREVVHAITNYSATTSRAIHYYLGDLLEVERQLWNPATGQKMTFNNDDYFGFATSNQ